MIDAATRRILLDLVRHEGRSLPVYISEAFPLAGPDDQAALDQLFAIVKEEQEAVAKVARYLQKHHVGIPPLGSYPQSFTTLNFISLDYLLPLLVQHEQRRIGELESQLAQVSDPHSRLLLQEIIDLKHRHVTTIESIKQPAAA